MSQKRTAKDGFHISVEQFVDGIFRGDRSILAKAITLVESSRTGDREFAEQIVDSCLAASGKSIRVGITGVPGAGKSTLIEALGRHIVANCDDKVAVLAIDPSSRVSGGSILGDKTRMTFLASSEKAFVRPSPTRGALGGVAQHTREAIVLCEAAGYRNIFVETVGVGQSEVAVRDLVDFFLLVAITGAGDELQGIKRGVMEMADAVAVNKADGENLRAAELARIEAENALHFLPPSPSGWVPRAFLCSARTGVGIRELWSSVLQYESMGRASGWLETARMEQERRWVHESLQAGLMQLFRSNPAVKRCMPEIERRVATGKITAIRAVRELLALYTAHNGEGRTDAESPENSSN